MVEVGSWKSFDDIEEHLILDELLLLTDQLNKKRHNEYRVAALAQGVDIDEDHETNESDLPPEIAEAERKFKEQREAKKLAKDAETGEMQKFAEGLGYEVVS